MFHEPIRFLIVDDILENLDALEALLRRDGLEVHRARSAAEALEKMLVHDYALALLDVHMPETDGYELAELMRGAERTRRIPIIFVTAAEVDETRRFRGYEAGAVDYIVKPVDPVVLKSKAEVFFRIGQQSRDLARQRDEMQAMAQHRDDAMARLKAHVDNSPLGFVECDSELVLRSWSKGAERIFGLTATQVIGRPAEEAWLPEAQAAVLREWLGDPQDSDTPHRHTTELTLARADGTEISCELYGSVLADKDGRRSVSLQVLDTTERHRAVAVQSLLIGELNHRIKNTLANVQAIARQTVRRSADLAAFDASFSGRLQALSRAHSILSDATWSSAPLDDLIDDQVRVGTLDGERLRRSGPSVEISPENMLRIALTLHELGTNAHKYGALSVPEGHVSLDWSLDGEGLVLRWQERGGPQVAEPARTGFGTTLIRSGAGGAAESVTVDWAPEGVTWTIRLPSGVAPIKGKTAPVAAPAPVVVTGQELRGLDVLVVEDEAVVAFDLQMELEDLGARSVAIARNIEEAIGMATNARADIALLDGNLAGERVDRVAELLAGRGIPFCFVSGYGREHLPANFDRVPIVEKPFHTDKLHSTLRSLITERAKVPA